MIIRNEGSLTDLCLFVLSGKKEEGDRILDALSRSQITTLQTLNLEGNPEWWGDEGNMINTVEFLRC